MTSKQIEEIRARYKTRDRLMNLSGEADQDVADTAALLAHIDRYALLTPEVIEAAIRGIESSCEEFGWDEESSGALDVLESLKEDK